MRSRRDKELWNECVHGEKALDALLAVWFAPPRLSPLTHSRQCLLQRRRATTKLTDRDQERVRELLAGVLDAEVVGHTVKAARRHDEDASILGGAVVLDKHAVHELQRTWEGGDE